MNKMEIDQLTDVGVLVTIGTAGGRWHRGDTSLTR
jgi:hypothetical protein